MKLINYIELVEVPTPSTSKTRFYFAEQPNLRNRRVLHITTGSVTEISLLPSGKTGMNATVFNKAFLVLASKGREVINRYPLCKFLKTHHKQDPVLIDRVIDWPKSYIEIPSTTGLNAAEAFPIVVYCGDKPQAAKDMNRSANIELMEIKTTPATITKFMFPDNELLRGKQIQHIEWNRDTPAVTPGNYNIVNNTVEIKAFLNLESNGRIVFKNVPLDAFDVENFAGFKWPLENIAFDFPNCHILVPNTTGIVADEVFMLYFIFYDQVIK